jgi:plasmid stability protein
MAQIIIRNLNDPVLEQLAIRARSEGMSVEELARHLLIKAVSEQPAGGLGSQMAALFTNCGLDEPLELPPREPLAEPRVRFDDDF